MINAHHYLISSPTAAKILGMHRTALTQWVRLGRLPESITVYMCGGTDQKPYVLLFNKEEIEQLARQRAERGYVPRVSYARMKIK